MLDSDEFLKKLHKEVRLVHSSVIYYSGTKSCSGQGELSLLEEVSPRLKITSTYSLAMCAKNHTCLC